MYVYNIIIYEIHAHVVFYMLYFIYMHELMFIEQTLIKSISFLLIVTYVYKYVK